jgi:S-adenosylmethionine hydrolase
MQIVTLTTDMGQSDYYLGALKGSLLSKCIDIHLVDIATHVPHFKLRQAASILQNAFPYFPKGTIHIMNVSASDAKGRMLCIHHHGHYFIFFDNGAITLVFDGVPPETYLINDDVAESSSLLFAEGIANVINAITSGLGLSIIGHRVQQVKSQRLMIPQQSPGFIKGTVIYFDQYGNAITNITKEMFDLHIGQSRFRIEFGTYEINKISQHYSEVDVGDMVGLFNAENRLEIALNKYNAANMLSLRLDTSTILVEKLKD